MRSRLIAAAAFALSILIAGTAEGKEKRRTKSGMSYYLVKPGSMNPKKPNDILIMLHGRGDNPDYFMGWCNLRFAGKYVRVYPFQSKPPMFEPSDLPKMIDIISELKKEFKVGRVIVFGFSNGAQYAFMLGLQYPLVISGVIPHSGAIPYPSVPKGEDNKRVAFAIIHGDQDRAVPVNDSRRAEKMMKEAGYKWVKYWELPGHAHSVDFGTTEKAHNWMLEVFRKGGGGGEAPWSKEEVEKKLDDVKKLVAEKKFKEAADALKSLDKKGRYLTSKTQKIVADALKPLTESADRGTKLFGVKSLGYAESSAASTLKKLLSEAEKEKDEELYLAALAGMAKVGEKALSTLHSIMNKSIFGFKAAKAAVEAVESIRLPKSAKQLASLLASVEKTGGEKKEILLEPVQKALKTITGASCGSAEEWKKWIKENKFK